jgi:osmotically-inducible protein OsmY
MEAFMNPYKAVAALIAAGVTGVALAAPVPPTWRAESEYKLADEPIATSLTGAAADDEIIKGVVAALNQDASLKGSKITVSNDQGVVTLTGVADNEQQSQKAAQIALAKAGDGNVVNVIQAVKMTYQTSQMQENQRKIDQAQQMDQG